jgi:hypothetical protein
MARGRNHRPAERFSHSDRGHGLSLADMRSYTFYGCPHAPNQVAPINVSDPRTSEFVNTTRKPSNTTALPSYWFNPNSFALEAIGTIGNAGRNNFAGPGMNNTDLSLSKRVYFGTENQRRFLELRLEAFNARSITHSSRWSPRPMAAAGYPEILTLPNSVEFCRPRLDGPFRSERNSTSEPDPVLKNVLKLPFDTRLSQVVHWQWFSFSKKV